MALLDDLKSAVIGLGPGPDWVSRHYWWMHYCRLRCQDLRCAPGLAAALFFAWLKRRTGWTLKGFLFLRSRFLFCCDFAQFGLLAWHLFVEMMLSWLSRIARSFFCRRFWLKFCDMACFWCFCCATAKNLFSLNFPRINIISCENWVQTLRTYSIFYVLSRQLFFKKTFYGFSFEVNAVTIYFLFFFSDLPQIS